MGLLGKLFGPKKPRAEFVEVNDENFESEVIKSDLPVMLFVWSSTCHHCKKMVPNVKSVSSRFAGKIKSSHTNSQFAPNTVRSLDVRGVPALFFFDKGKVVANLVGFKPESYIDEVIDTHFANPG